MNKKKKKLLRILALALAILMLAGVLYSVLDSVILSVRGAELDELNEQQEELEEENAALREQQRELAAERASLQSSIAALQEDIAGIQQQKEQYDRLLELTEEELVNLAGQIDVMEREIDLKTQEYDAAVMEEERRWEQFCAQMRSMEESGEITYLDILFSGDLSDFADLLGRIDAVNEVNARGEQLIQDMEIVRQNVALAQQALYEAKDKLLEKQQEQEDLQQEYEDLREESTKRIQELEGELELQLISAEEQAELAAELERQIRQNEIEAANLTARIEELERLELLKNAGVTATGTYLWPSSDSYYVTSLFGNRFHPILHYWRNHNGIDIGAPYNTNIYAADGGIVVVSESSYSYGNYVMIAHGNGRFTLYAHMNKRLVDVDDVVKQGDVIGLVGSTGYSNGPHIHFEVYENNERVDPLQFFSNYTILD